jgi:hypothetical protein
VTGWRNGTLTAYVVGIVGAFLIFAALVWAMWYYTRPAPLGEDRVAIRRKALAEMRAAEAEQLHNYGWVDATKGIVRLPIAEAMKLALAQGQNPAAARSNLIARVEKAFPPPPPPPPKAPEKPSQYE